MDNTKKNNINLVKNSLILGGIILVVLYFPVLILHFAQIEFLKGMFVITLVSLQVLPGFIYSLAQFNTFSKINNSSEGKSFLFVIFNSILYVLVFQFMENEFFRDFDELRQILGPTLGAVLYLTTIKYIYKLNFKVIEFLIVIVFGLLIGYLCLVFKDNSSNFFGQLLYSLIPIWQIGMSIIIQYSIIKRNYSSTEKL